MRIKLEIEKSATVCNVVGVSVLVDIETKVEIESRTSYDAEGAPSGSKPKTKSKTGPCLKLGCHGGC